MSEFRWNNCKKDFFRHLSLKYKSAANYLQFWKGCISRFHFSSGRWENRNKNHFYLLVYFFLSFFFQCPKICNIHTQFGIKHPFKHPTQSFARPVSCVLIITDNNHLNLESGQQIYSFPNMLFFIPVPLLLSLSPSKYLIIHLLVRILRVCSQLQMLRDFCFYSYACL